MLFTIATCTYNAAAVLPATLRSVAAQTLPSVEHLIIDGASSDDTLALVRRYEAENAGPHHINIVSEPDGGLYFAMNKALARAQGRYILFLNAGDTLAAPDTLARAAACLTGDGGLTGGGDLQSPGQHDGGNVTGDGDLKSPGQTDADQSRRLQVAAPSYPAVLYADTDIVDAAGRFLRHRRPVPQALTWRSFRWGMSVCHQAFFAATDIAARTPYDTALRLSADVDWCIRVMREAEKERRALVNLHMVSAHYLAGGMSVQSHRASLAERFRVMRRHYGLASTVFCHVWFAIRAAWRTFRS